MPGRIRIRRTLPESTSATIIIPFRDEPALLMACIQSIDATCEDVPKDFILINNGSTQPETLDAGGTPATTP